MKSYFKNVLFLGPQYKNYKGGIGAVLATYADNIEHFKFIPTYDENFGKMRNIPLFIVSLLRVSLKLIYDNEIKIAHIHGASRGSFLRKYCFFFVAKHLFRRKVVYHIHGGGFQKFYQNSPKVIKLLIRNFIENSDCVVCLSQQWYSFYDKNFNNLNLKVIHNPIISPTNNHARRNSTSENIFKLLFLGKVHNDKGIFDLLHAIAINKDSYRGRLKVYIGGYGEVQRLKKSIEVNQITDIVEYIGWVTDESKQAYLSSCDALILPSYYEGLPISILEAMSYGKVVLASNVGGIPEIVEHGENGYLFEPGDLNAIHKYLVEFINNRQKTITMGCKSLPKVNPYLAPNVMKQLAGIYQSILV